MSDSFFKAIADGNRRRILLLLRKHSRLSAGEIAEHFEITKASVSDHLKVLRHAGLIAAEKKGQFIYYRLTTTVFEDMVNWVLDYIEQKEVEDEKNG
ncbi:MAG: helix-turn-helix transcriptional regulator [Candidatus Cloacimonetes bacterium]|nr:helix-turn-helix transcriptional regulator [Candidatus Cloacimonadota bacterium]